MPRKRIQRHGRTESIRASVRQFDGADLFFAAGREHGEFEKGDLRIEFASRSSRVFRFSAGRWRQIHTT
jgi:hypothetical protein